MQLSPATDNASRTKRNRKAYPPMTAFANKTANYELQSVITMLRRADVLSIGVRTLGALQRVISCHSIRSFKRYRAVYQHCSPKCINH